MLGHSTYLVLELVWAAPVLFLQWAVGWQPLREKSRVLALSIAVSTAYLSFLDGIAIANGIWSLHSQRILGPHLANVPLEEIVFFFLTNTMVAQAVVLVSGWRTGRMKQWAVPQ